MFKPGHLSRVDFPNGCSRQHFSCDIRYRVCNDPDRGQLLQVSMSGAVDGKPFAEEFELHRDIAYNVFSRVARIAARNGLSLPGGPVLRGRAEYDAMYADIRRQLDLRPGERIDLRRLADLNG